MSKKNKAKVIPTAVYTPVNLPSDLEGQLRSFLEYIINESSSSNPLDSEIFFGNRDEGFLYLNSESSDRFRIMLRTLIQRLCQSEMLSETATNKLLETAVLETIDANGGRLEMTSTERINFAVQNFRNSITGGYRKFVFYLPVHGLSNNGLPFTFGNVEFDTFQENYAEELQLNPDKQPTDEKAEFARISLDEFRKRDFWGTPYVKIVSGAYDVNAARKNALREIRACIDILNFYADLIDYTSGFIYLPGEAGREVIIAPYKDADNPTKRTMAYVVEGPISPISIEALLKQENEQGLGFTRIQELARGNRNQYEELLLTAIRWAGKANVLAYQDRKEDAFLLYMIALETVIAPEHTTEITYRISLRLAHLLASGTDNRPGMAKRVKDLYGIRSSIVHSGSFEVKAIDLASIRYLVKNCLVHLLRDEPFSEMKSVENLLQWFDNKIFG